MQQCRGSSDLDDLWKKHMNNTLIWTLRGLDMLEVERPPLSGTVQLGDVVDG